MIRGVKNQGMRKFRLHRNGLEIIQLIRCARIVVHRIGDALHRAQRRKLKQAMWLAEYRPLIYASRIYSKQKLSLLLLEVQKGEAIAAVLKFGYEDVLVTDEDVARVML